MEFIEQDGMQKDITKRYFFVKPEPRSPDFILDASVFGRKLPRLLKQKNFPVCRFGSIVYSTGRQDR